MFTDQHTELRINEDLASRARDGLWGHPMCLTLVLFSTTLFADHPVIMSAFALLFAVQTCARFVLIRQISDFRVSGGTHWRFWMLCMLMGSGLLWGLLAAWSCAVYGFHDSNSYLLLLYHSAISVIGTELFVHDRRMGQWYLFALFVPPTIVHIVLLDRHAWGPLCAFSFYIVFLTVRLKRLCGAYDAKLAETRALEASARRDPLTGLLNRLAMKRHMDHEIAGAGKSGQKIALLFIDLDGFKTVNDTWSHRVGDLLLCEIASRLSACAGSSHRVARLGGDEFTILLTDPQIVSSRAAVMSFAEGVLEAVCRTVRIEERICEVGASVGVGVFPDDASSADHLIRAADRAMYEAKRTGKKRVCLFGAGKAIMGAFPRDIERLEDVLTRSQTARSPA